MNKKILKELKNMNIIDLKWICKELNLNCSPKKKNMIKTLLKPLHKRYRINISKKYEYLKNINIRKTHNGSLIKSSLLVNILWPSKLKFNLTESFKKIDIEIDKIKYLQDIRSKKEWKIL